MTITAIQRWQGRLLGVAIISAFPAAIACTVVTGTALVDRYQAIGTAATCSGESQQQRPAWARGGPLLLLGSQQWSPPTDPPALREPVMFESVQLDRTQR